MTKPKNRSDRCNEGCFGCHENAARTTSLGSDPDLHDYTIASAVTCP